MKQIQIVATVDGQLCQRVDAAFRIKIDKVRNSLFAAGAYIQSVNKRSPVISVFLFEFKGRHQHY